MADKVCQNERSVANRNLDLKSMRDSSTKLAGFEGDSPEDLTERLLNLQSLSIEELMKIAEAQIIESELEKQLEIKHQRDLLEHVLRQQEEMRELKKQLKTMNLEESGGTSMLSSKGQPASLDSLVLAQVVEKDGKRQSMGSEEVPDVPLSPELSPLGVEVSPNVSCDEDEDGMFTLDSKVITCRPMELSNEDYSGNQLPSIQCGKWKTANYGSLRTAKLMQPHCELQKGHLSSFNELPKCKFNTHLFKTVICRRWTQFGYCPYGESCQFAHGAKELRMRPIMHRKFKTVRCKKYLAGYCPYGTRCCFVHDISEQKTVPGKWHSLPPGRDTIPNWTGRYSYVHGDISPLSVGDMDIRRRRSSQLMTYHPRIYRI